jgi:hypothetical protein
MKIVLLILNWFQNKLQKAIYETHIRTHKVGGGWRRDEE